MSKLVKRIEKDVLLKALSSELIPLICYRGRDEYKMFLVSATKDDMVFSVNKPIDDLNIEEKISLGFNYHGEFMIFQTIVLEEHDGGTVYSIICTIPESIRRNLDRSHLRISPSSNISVKVSFVDDRYTFPLPRLRKYSYCKGDFAKFQFLGKEVEQLVSSKGYEYTLKIFDENELTETEEKVIAHTGKTLFISKVEAGIPQEDLFEKGAIITNDDFIRYLFADQGIEDDVAEAVKGLFLQKKESSGVTSDAWVPILFQEYAVGYIRICLKDKSKPPISKSDLEMLYMYADLMAQSLEKQGAFDKMKMERVNFETFVHDISGSGILFSCLLPEIAPKMIPGCEINVLLSTHDREMELRATVVRLFLNNETIYIGCRFKDMTDEESEYLINYIYSDFEVKTGTPHLSVISGSS
jgi:hypothetical protein